MHLRLLVWPWLAAAWLARKSKSLRVSLLCATCERKGEPRVRSAVWRRCGDRGGWWAGVGRVRAHDELLVVGDDGLGVGGEREELRGVPLRERMRGRGLRVCVCDGCMCVLVGWLKGGRMWVAGGCAP